MVAQRAFELFERRGCTNGNDQEDSFPAESELLTLVKVHLSVSGEHFTARAKVPGFSRQEINVSIEPRRLSISGRAETEEDHNPGKQTHSLRHGRLICKVIDLPTAVDLSKARATFRDGALEVVMPQANPAESVRAKKTLALSA